MIKQRTLDLLDSDLRKHETKYKNMDYDDRFKIFSHEIRIDPYWSTKKFIEISKYNIQWNSPLKYSDFPNLDTIIKDNDIGLYMFYIKPNETICEMPKFVLYIGMSGENSSNRPVRERLKDHFNINNIKKRDHVHKMFQLYYDYIYFIYANYDNKYSLGSIEKLEILLHEYFSPKFAKRDFEPPTKAARKSWN